MIPRLRKRQSVATVAQTIVTLSTALFAGSLIVFTLTFTYYEQQVRSDEMRSSYVALQKDIARSEVDSMVDLINERRENMRRRAMSKAEERALQAHTIAKSIHQDFLATKPENEILQTILAALRPVRFNESGYFFVIGLDGTIHLSAGLPDSEGKAYTSLDSAEHRSAVERLITQAETNGEGFVEYEWAKPGVPETTYSKIAYLKQFAPYNLIIGSGLYIDDEVASLKRACMDDISSIRYGDNGYFFINDLEGKVLAHGYEPQLVGAEKWEYTDSRGNKLFQDLRKAVENPAGGFANYWWRMPETGEERPKIAFARSIPEWEWLIGTGVYVDEVEADIADMQAELRNAGLREIAFILIVSILIILLIHRATGILFRPLRKDIGFFNECFALAAQENVTIDTTKIKFSELRHIAENANRMLREKEAFVVKLREDKKEKKELEARLVHAQKMEAIGTLAGGIAHDFNNVLGVILGYTEIAQSRTDPDTKVGQDLEKILEAAHRARDLTRQILTFSRQTEVEQVPVNISPIIREGLRMLRSSIPSTISISESVTREDVTVLADPTQIHQILLNLATNAYHAMQETGGVLSVGLTTATIQPEQRPLGEGLPGGDYAELTITDTGKGISPEIQRRIFEPYFTTKKVDEGTGMGLAIAHGIVTKCGGSINFESKLGKGTTFTVYLPIVPNETTQPAEAPEKIPRGNEHILLVDDEEPLAEMGKDLLESLGYTVTTRTGSREALADFQKAPDAFDLVLTDQTMPGMTGAEMAREMIQARPDIPIILCTGYSTQIDASTAKAIGIKEFVLKPFTKMGLAHLLRKVLDDNETAR